MLDINFMLFKYGMKGEIQLLKRFPDSSVSSPLIRCGVEGHPATKNVLQYPWVDNWLVAIFPQVVVTG